MTDKALAYLGEDRSQPFFLFLHYLDPHWDCDPPPGFAERFDPDWRGNKLGELEDLLPFSDPAVPLPEEMAE